VRTGPTDTSRVRGYVDVRNELITHQPTDMLTVVPQVLWLNVDVTAAIMAAHS
jgi:uncharacterized membrane protein